jgi:PPP family 3-phenylpropionic acid transporter
VTSDAASVRFSYLFVFAALASLIPFVSIYYKSLDFSGQQIGWLLGMPLLISVVATPAWGALADATHRHRRTLVVAVAGSAAGAALIPVSDRFLIVFPIAILQAVMFAPVTSLLDNGALTLLGSQTHRYSRFRLWGTVGWGISAPLVGWLVAAQGARWIFAVYVSLMGCLLVFASRLPIAERRPAEGFRSRVSALSRSGPLWTFLGVAFIGGVGMSMVNAYLPLYLNRMHATGLIGVALLIATISEVPVMLLGPAILQRLGLARAFVLALVLYGLRALALSFAATPWIVLALQLLHGPTFALMLVSGVALARRLAPAGVGAVAQGLFGSVSNGLGGAVGAVLGGRLYDQGGPVASGDPRGGGAGGQRRRGMEPAPERGTGGCGGRRRLARQPQPPSDAFAQHRIPGSPPSQSNRRGSV